MANESTLEDLASQICDAAIEAGDRVLATQRQALTAGEAMLTAERENFDAHTRFVDALRTLRAVLEGRARGSREPFRES